MLQTGLMFEYWHFGGVKSAKRGANYFFASITFEGPTSITTSSEVITIY